MTEDGQKFVDENSEQGRGQRGRDGCKQLKGGRRDKYIRLGLGWMIQGGQRDEERDRGRRTY